MTEMNTTMNTTINTTLPEWDDNKAMTAWMTDRLRPDDDAADWSQLAVNRVEVPSEHQRALRHASWWDYRPLKKLLPPEIAQHINPPKLQWGQKPPDNPFVAYGKRTALEYTVVRMAVADVYRIKALWRHYWPDEKYRGRDLISAAAIAAKIHGVTVSQIEREMRRRPVKPKKPLRKSSGGGKSSPR
jgi:hypothetical protein